MTMYPLLQHTRLCQALLAAGLLLGATALAQDLPASPSSVARIVTDSKSDSPDDLIFAIALAPGEQLRGISLDDNGLVTNLNSQFALIGQAGGISSFRLTPAIDFDRFIGYSATLKLAIVGPNGTRSLQLPIQVAPLSSITDALTLRQAVADDASSFVPQWPLRQAGDIGVTGVQTTDGAAFAYQLSSDASGQLLATAQAPLALPQGNLNLRINRQISPSGLNPSQNLSLTPIPFAALNASLEIQPDTNSSSLHFTVPGAWNTDVQDLRAADGASLLSRFRVERQDNGDTRFTLAPSQTLHDLGYPAQALQLTLQRRFADATGQQALRLLPASAAAHADAKTDTTSGANAAGNHGNVTIGDASASGKPSLAANTSPPVTIVPPQPRQDQAEVKKPQRAANRFAATRPLTGDITLFQYDNVGNLTQITDPLGRITQNSYDALNRVSKTTLPTFNGSAPTITNGYDGQDHLIQLTDPRGLITRYQVDGLGNLTQIISPDAGTTQQTQDIAGNLTSKTDARGQLQTRSYDSLRRLTKIVYNGATGNQLTQVQYGYDQGSNAIGRLSSVTELDAGGNTLNATSYAYDNMGRLSQETRSLPGGSTSTTRYTRAPGGAIASMTLPSGRLVTYSRDSVGRIASISTAAAGGQTQTVLNNVAYYPFGGVKSYTLGSGQLVTRTQDTQGRISSYTLGGVTQTISYDPASRITAISNGDATTSNSYAFDNLDHLTSATRNTQTQSFIYDANGNRLSRQQNGQTDQYNIDPASNRISSVAATVNPSGTYQYDAAGNLQNDGNRQFSYDSRGRLTQAILSAASPSASQYQVDAAGRRVRKNIGSADEIVFHYDLAGHLIAESRPNGSVIREMIYLLDIPVMVFQ